MLSDKYDVISFTSDLDDKISFTLGLNDKILLTYQINKRCKFIYIASGLDLIQYPPPAGPAPPCLFLIPEPVTGRDGQE